MKRIIAFIMSLSFVFVFAGCNIQENAKQEIFQLVEENYDTILKACEEKDVGALSAIPGITKVKIDHGYVLVYCKSHGIAPSSQDYGFYYSEDNRPVAVDYNLYIICDANGLTKAGNGYQYVDYEYNTFYTEHIKGKLYFYSNDC